MRLFLTFLTVLILSSCADNSMSQRDMNLKVVNTFWDNILTFYCSSYQFLKTINVTKRY